MKKPKNNMTKIALLVAALIVIASIFVLIFFKDNGSEDTPETTGIINYSPPTEEELLSANEKKKEIVSENDNKTADLDAHVTIVDANQYENSIEIRAFASNVVQDGMCVITFTRNSTVITKQTSAYADASSTPCANIEVPRSEFAENGEWKVSVAYTSSDGKYKGESTIVMVLK